MVGWPSSAHRGRRRKRSVHDLALTAYEEAAKSLMRVVEASEAAATAYSSLAGPAFDDGRRKMAAGMAADGAERKACAEDLLQSCCLDGAGRLDVVPGVWRDDIAAGAEGMAALAALAAALLAVNGAPSSISTARAVLAELSASDGWAEFAARVAAAERAADGTVLGARPVEGQAAVAARFVGRSMSMLLLEAKHAGGGGGAAAGAAAGAGGTGANGGRAAAMRREAANVWAEASTAWSKARDLAAGEDDSASVHLASVQARLADESEARLRAV